MLRKLIAQIREHIDTHEATKGRPKLFQSIVILVVIIILVFIIAKLRNWGPLNS